MFDEMAGLGIITATGTITSFIKLLCSYGPPHAMLMIFKKARKAGCSISLSAYKLSLTRLAKFGKCGMMLNIWDDMQESGYSSDVEVYQHIIIGLCNNGQLENAILVTEKVALEVLDIEQCNSLRAFPIELGNIKSLIEFKANRLRFSRLPNTIGSLTKLVELKLSENYRLKSLPDTICNLRALEMLTISHCSSLETLPEELGNFESLKELNAEGLRVSTLPDSIGRLSKLVALRLSGNRNLEILPDTICNLRELEVLDIYSCINLKELPMELGNLESLKELIVENLAVPMLPNSLGFLSKLVELKLSNNYSLETLPDTICNLTALKNLELEDCCYLLSIPELPPNLKWICIAGCTSMERLPDLSILTAGDIGPCRL